VELNFGLAKGAHGDGKSFHGTENDSDGVLKGVRDTKNSGHGAVTRGHGVVKGRDGTVKGDRGAVRGIPSIKQGLIIRGEPGRFRIHFYQAVSRLPKYAEAITGSEAGFL
jgi:hypothetical protein